MISDKGNQKTDGALSKQNDWTGKRKENPVRILEKQLFQQVLVTEYQQVEGSVKSSTADWAAFTACSL